MLTLKEAYILQEGNITPERTKSWETKKKNPTQGKAQIGTQCISNTQFICRIKISYRGESNEEKMAPDKIIYKIIYKI